MSIVDTFFVTTKFVGSTVRKADGYNKVCVSEFRTHKVTAKAKHTIPKYATLHTIQTLYAFVGKIILSKLKWLKSVQI